MTLSILQGAGNNDPGDDVGVCSHLVSQMTHAEDDKAANAPPLRSSSASRTPITIRQRRKEEQGEIIRAYGTHASMHVHDSRGLYKCSKCENRYYDLYLVASHESGCKGEKTQKNARFDGVHGSNTNLSQRLAKREACSR